jgi:uncharacterized protein with FMN-binding domain
MRRLTHGIVSTVAAVVLLFSYRTSLGAGGTGAAQSRPVILTSPASASPGRTLTVDGPVARTRWGPVQVEAKIQNHKIIDVRALRHPDGNDRDTEINAYALPQLRAEVLAAQSAKVDAVSGATVTSGGYLKSLQAALDAAHFA